MAGAQVDVDHDGTLDLEEFKAMAIKMGVKMTQPEMGDVSQKRTASPPPSMIVAHELRQAHSAQALHATMWRMGEP